MLMLLVLVLVLVLLLMQDYFCCCGAEWGGVEWSALRSTRHMQQYLLYGACSMACALLHLLDIPALVDVLHCLLRTCMCKVFSCLYLSHSIHALAWWSVVRAVLAALLNSRDSAAMV